MACIDGDAVLDFDAIDYMVQSLELNRTYSAVTGNPRVRNRSTILGRLQVSEFSSIIGLIKTRSKPDGNHFHRIRRMLSLPQRCDGRNWWLEHQYDHRRH